MASKKKQAMVITLSGKRPASQVVRDLKAAGFEVDQVLDAIGSVTGSGDPKIKQQLESIGGVSDVKKAHDDFDIGPPGAIS
jgi:hypothetical protein